MKKYFAVFLLGVLALFVGTKVLSVEATESGSTFKNAQCGEETYATLDSNGVLTISGTGATWDFREEGDIYADNYGVAPWKNCKNSIKSVVFTGNVTYIGADAFGGCANLTTITLNEAMESIGNFAFLGCARLTTINWSTGLSGIGQQAFDGCGFTEINLPDEIAFIDANVFADCTKLKKVSIGACNAGSFCIGNSVFGGCTSLESITVSEEHFALMSVDGVLYNAIIDENGNKYPSALQDYPTGKKDKTCVVPETVTVLNQFSIESNPYLESVTLPEGLQEMTHVFTTMRNLKSLTIPKSVTVVSDVCTGCENIQWMKNESDCEFDLYNYGDIVCWVDADGNSINKLGKGTAYGKKLRETQTDASGENMTTSDSQIDSPAIDEEATTQDTVVEDKPAQQETTTAKENVTIDKKPVEKETTTKETTTKETTTKETATKETTIKEKPTSSSTEEMTTVLPETSTAEKNTLEQESTTVVENTTEEETTVNEEATNKAPEKIDESDIVKSENVVDTVKSKADNSDSTVEVIINEPTVIDKEMLNYISDNDKNVVIGVVDEENQLKYSWTFSGKAIKDAEQKMDLSISFETEKKNEIEEKVGNKNSLYIQFSHHGELAGAATITMYVGDNYVDGEQLYLYYYNEEEKETVMVGNKAIEVKDGYVAYTIMHCSTYFLDTEKFDVKADENSLEDVNVTVENLVLNDGEYEQSDENVSSEEVSSGEEVASGEKISTEKNDANNGKEENDGNAMVIILTIIAVLVVAGAVATVVILRKRTVAE